MGGADNHSSEGPDRRRNIDEARQTAVKQSTRTKVQVRTQKDTKFTVTQTYKLKGVKQRLGKHENIPEILYLVF